MEALSFILEAFRLILYSLYPLYILYTNFLFLGLFILDPKIISDAFTIFFFIIFNILQTLIIIYYIMLYTSDSKGTQDIFLMASEKKTHQNLGNINPFIAETLQKETIQRAHICKICKTNKPPRCHHCSRCNKCYLKMDHHCLFLDVCIGFHNYKFFIQFLVTNTIYIIIYVVVLCIDIGTTKSMSAVVITNFIVSLCLSGIVFICVLTTLIFHIKLLSYNETTIEYLSINAYLSGDHSHINVFQEGPISEFNESKDRKVLNPYNLGTNENWKEVFGPSLKDAISPLFTSTGDGVKFKKNYKDDEDDEDDEMSFIF
ncbi:Palmitoyltransferase zdhhc20 [Glugoides intestinalis]